MGEKAPQRRQDDGRLSLLPTLTERKIGPARFPRGWRRQVANRSRLASGSVGRLSSRIRTRQKALCHPPLERVHLCCKGSCEFVESSLALSCCGILTEREIFDSAKTENR